MHLPQPARAPGGTRINRKLEAAMILKGVVRVVTQEGPVEVEPKTWYRESGEQYLEARRRDSGEHVRMKLTDIQDVTAY